MKKLFKFLLIIIAIIAIVVLIAAAAAAIAGATTVGAATGFAGTTLGAIGSLTGMAATTAISTVALYAGVALIATMVVYDLAVNGGKLHKQVTDSVVLAAKRVVRAVAKPLQKAAKTSFATPRRIVVTAALVAGAYLLYKATAESSNEI